MTDWNGLALPQLFEALVDREDLAGLIETARREDLGDGDLTCRLCIAPERRGSAVMRARQGGRLAGMVLLPIIAARYDRQLAVDVCQADGTAVEAGQVVARLSGPLASLLAAERVLLNFASHLSGIATLTARYVAAVAGTGAKIYDTRKTIPGWRGLAKYAVRCGGGFCHRLGLYDAVLIKDNHLAGVGLDELAGKLAAVVEAAGGLERRPDFIEVEVDDLDQFRRALDSPVDVILLDNFTVEQLAEAVAMRDRLNRDVLLEASGAVDLGTVESIARTGVDRIAVGALTHSAPALDLGVDIDV